MGKHERGRSETGLSQTLTMTITDGVLRDNPDITARSPKLSEVCAEGRCFSCLGHDKAGGCECPEQVHTLGLVGLDAMREQGRHRRSRQRRAIPRPSWWHYPAWLDRACRNPGVIWWSKIVTAVLVPVIVVLSGVLVNMALLGGEPAATVKPTPSKSESAEPATRQPRQPRQILPVEPRLPQPPPRTTLRPAPTKTQGQAPPTRESSPEPPKTTAPESPPPPTEPPPTTEPPSQEPMPTEEPQQCPPNCPTPEQT